MNLFTGVELATLSTWLTEAQLAYNELQTGKQLVSLSKGDQRISFTAADVDKLRTYIKDLQVAIAAAAGNSNRRKGVYLRGGKGL